MEVADESDGDDRVGGSVSVDGGGVTLATAGAVVCVDEGRVMEVADESDRDDRVDGSVSVDGGGVTLATAGAVVCVDGSKLTGEPPDGGDCQR